MYYEKKRAEIYNQLASAAQIPKKRGRMCTICEFTLNNDDVYMILKGNLTKYKMNNCISVFLYFHTLIFPGGRPGLVGPPFRFGVF